MNSHEVVCPHCGAHISSDDRTCPVCGKTMPSVNLNTVEHCSSDLNGSNDTSSERSHTIEMVDPAQAKRARTIIIIVLVLIFGWPLLITLFGFIITIIGYFFLVKNKDKIEEIANSETALGTITDVTCEDDTRCIATYEYNVDNIYYHATVTHESGRRDFDKETLIYYELGKPSEGQVYEGFTTKEEVTSQLSNAPFIIATTALPLFIIVFIVTKLVKGLKTKKNSF